MEMQWYNLLQAQALSSFHVSVASVLFDQHVITFVTLLWIPSKLLRRCPRLNIIICPWLEQSYREIILHYMSPCIVDTSVNYTLLVPHYTTSSHIIICSVSYLCFISTSLGFSLCVFTWKTILCVWRWSEGGCKQKNTNNNSEEAVKVDLPF